LTAFFISFLASLPGPILNRPTARGLAGPQRDAFEWTTLAARVQMKTVACHQSTGRSPLDTVSPFPKGASVTRVAVVVVSYRHLVGYDVPSEISRACRDLAVLSDTALLGISLQTDGSDWVFDGATIWPDLRAGGRELVDVMAEVLLSGGGA